LSKDAQNNLGEKTMKIFDNKGGAEWLFNVILLSLKKLKSVQDDKLVSKLIDEPNKTKYDKLYLLDRAKDHADKKAMAIILEVENFFKEVKE
tara:strand:+ start:86 stop:361 length:276 start_codon:yes stop_codon:yes gene_type:complete